MEGTIWGMRDRLPPNIPHEGEYVLSGSEVSKEEPTSERPQKGGTGLETDWSTRWK